MYTVLNNNFWHQLKAVHLNVLVVVFCDDVGLCVRLIELVVLGCVSPSPAGWVPPRDAAMRSASGQL